MKIISDTITKQFLRSNLNKDFILNELQPVMLNALQEYKKEPAAIPARTVVGSNCNDNTHLFMPCASTNNLGVKVVTGGPSNNANNLGFVGPIVILDQATGSMQGVVNAKTVTAFRTALATSIGLVKALDPNDPNLKLLPRITIFGVGPQATWHVKLALELYSLKHVNVINRSQEKAEKFVDELRKDYPDVKFDIYLYGSISADALQQSSIFFGCTPSTEPVLKQEFINRDKSYKKFIGLIGSYKPHMIELDLDYIKSSIKDKVKVMVDSKEHSLHEAGEFIQSGITEDELVEFADIAHSDASEFANEDNVSLSKVVGLSIMDIAVAKFFLGKCSDSVEVDF